MSYSHAAALGFDRSVICRVHAWQVIKDKPVNIVSDGVRAS